ncbi:8-oxo-dGTP diphosphatase MutT [Corynebacterium yudongzhengii]|uniref:8-oxo-dGTP diphosphatase n=1 Tax=Corynebacterium yudongzhengii TaxID=2080740 RepID=A0A2U1T9M3_9CORY|nr:(deoxy)nucleoside triphosphate pyrophosphohydrolase [Corynebacterium yudongzhengii]AWB81162.1 8-oxo-dGTP diphosphatase MutT [Corynebacterium yudongzhengii]PWC02701.1 (deoxy)nucleoside triphosphate pyrophosphohydrolase [Corynebacterium yudongzhengii]
MAKKIDVVGAVIVRDGMILAVQRGAQQSLPGSWEFPGGKIEPGEDARSALIRELDEELLCEITVGEFLTTTSYDYPFGTVVLSTYFCELVSGEPRLTEHSQLRWLAPSELRGLDWAPADVPAVQLIEEKLGG